MVSLTGDTATGREIAAAAAQTVKRVHLELGGKAPVLVFDDADLDAMAEAVKLGGFFNSGQDCTAATRVIVAKPAYEKALGDPRSTRSTRSRWVTRPTTRSSTWARWSAAGNAIASAASSTARVATARLLRPAAPAPARAASSTAQRS